MKHVDILRGNKKGGVKELIKTQQQSGSVRYPKGSISALTRRNAGNTNATYHFNKRRESCFIITSQSSLYAHQVCRSISFRAFILVAQKGPQFSLHSKIEDYFAIKQTKAKTKHLFLSHKAQSDAIGWHVNNTKGA